MNEHFHTVIIGGGRVSIGKNFPSTDSTTDRFVRSVCPVMLPLTSN